MRGQDYAQERGWKRTEAKSGRTSMDSVLHTQSGFGAAEHDQLKSADSGGSTADRKGKKLRQGGQTRRKR